MTMEVHINKSQIANTALQTAPVAAEESVVLEQFSMILDQEVSRTREKTTTADNSPENSQQVLEKQTRAAVQKNITKSFNFKQNVLIADQPVKSTEKLKEQTTAQAEEQESVEDAEPKTVSGGLIQTQIQQVIEKNNFQNMPLEKLNLALTKPLPQTAQLPVSNFEEIYAQVMQAMRMQKDGQIIKLKFALEPESLGKIDLYVFADKKNLHLAFAAGEDTRKILQTAQIDLKELLAGFGYSLADLDFSGYSGARHQELEGQFLAQNNEKTDYGILKIVEKKDIISEIKYLVRDILVNYLA